MIKKYTKHLLLVGLITGLMTTQVNDTAYAKEYETYTAVKGDCMWDISMISIHALTRSATANYSDNQ